jgi:hypothetical protein
MDIDSTAFGHIVPVRRTCVITDDDIIEALDRVLQVVLPDDPRRSAFRALEELRRSQHAESGVVFIPPLGPGRLDQYVTSPGTGNDAVDQAQESWARYRASIEEGDWYFSDGPPAGRHHLLVPYFYKAVLVAILYLDSGDPTFLRRVNRDRIAHLGRVFAATTGSRDPRNVSEIREHLSQRSVVEVKHAQLLVQLEEQGWNISRVAEKLGVSRPTVYNWIRDFNITRPQPQKG